MPVQTRSVAKKVASEAKNSAPLTAQGTFMEVEVSATGRGTHIRWRRPSEVEPDVPEAPLLPIREEDIRFTTPVPEDRPHPPAPPPLIARSEQRYASRYPHSESPPEEYQQVMREAAANLVGRKLQWGTISEDTSPGGSQAQHIMFPDKTPPMLPAIRASGEDLVDRSASFCDANGSDQLTPLREGQTPPNMRARGLGPEGTILVDEQTGEPLVFGLNKKLLN